MALLLFPVAGWGGPSATAFVCMATLWLALAIDGFWGEPPARLHPVVWMGRYLGWVGRRTAPPAAAVDTRRFGPFVAGTLAWCAGIAMVLLAALTVEAIARRLPSWLAWAVLGAALKPMLAWRMLRDEVLAVEDALGVSLEAGRARLARLVSRDVSALNAAQVRESAIESLAENLNDSVVAPVFWFVLAGLPGAAIYRFANTADAMWGYRGERGGQDWTWAGKFAARADDVLSWVPARITALLLAVAARRWPTGLWREAGRTPSPNSGWPMAAMALLLGVRLGKPGTYVLNAPGRVPESADLRHAVWWSAASVVLLAAAASVVLFGAARL